MLTVAYMTSRKEPQFWWFISSLRRQAKKWGGRIRVVMVDFWAQPLPWYNWDETDVQLRKKGIEGMSHDFQLLHVPPKPTVWQGPHRLTKTDFFSPSNARNTALCNAEDGHIAYVDDLSILSDTWLESVERAMNGNYIACGAFRKVKNLVSHNGKIVHFDTHIGGLDSRWGNGQPQEPHDCPASWLFGCSVLMPVSALEKINGWPEWDCDSTGIGAEDGFLGSALTNTGHVLKYDRRMFTYESEELHFQEPVMKRMNKGEIGTQKAKDWANVFKLNGVTKFNNDFTPFPDIAALRHHILKGGQFPIPKTPTHDWFDGQKICEL